MSKIEVDDKIKELLYSVECYHIYKYVQFIKINSDINTF